MDLEKAHEFLWTHGRLLERRLFEFLFLEGTRDAVERAVDAYQNADGGFGQALEPDCRTPHSQPEAMRLALVALETAGCLSEERARGAADWLASVSTPEGGVPFCLSSVEGFPKAPWWKAVPEPDLNPTGRLVALLRPHVPDHPWVRSAVDWCWEQISQPLSDGQYQVHATAEFLCAEPDRQRAQPVLDILGESLAAGRVVPLDPEAPPRSPDTHTPLNYATGPEHPLRGCFDDATIERFLTQLAASQSDDGGWPIDWPAPGMTATLEWRAIRTLEALQTLSSYGRL